MFVTSKGKERFTITGVVKDERLPSVLVCEVEMMQEDDVKDNKPEVRSCVYVGRKQQGTGISSMPGWAMPGLDPAWRAV